MKRFYFSALCLLIVSFAVAAPKYWVGPRNGDWSNAANWSNTLNGGGGAGIPGNPDTAFFTSGLASLVHVDVSPTISSLKMSGNVTLYASSPVVLTILKLLVVPNQQTLKDSTSADVSFNVVFSGASGAQGSIMGDWFFEGGVPVSNADNSGARFTSEPGALVTVSSLSNPSAFNPYQGFAGGRVIYKINSGNISSTASTLTISNNSTYMSDNKPEAVVPLASWAPPTSNSPAGTLMITGDFKKFTFKEAVPNWGNLTIDAPTLSSDIDLSLPNGTVISSDLYVLHTNGHTVTLLASTDPGGSITVTVGTQQAPYGSIIIGGTNTKVAMARATASAPGTSYQLNLLRTYLQMDGNFSLQDYNGATGSSILTLKNIISQTGGTFYTNSTSTTAKFTVGMLEPDFTSGPSGAFASQRSITMSSGSIDNATHNVTLRIDHTVYVEQGYESFPNGVILSSPLQVGKLELVRSPLTTSTVNMLTVNNPSPDAISIGGPSDNVNHGIASGPTATSYVNGPVRRATNSTQPYFFPTGKGNFYNTASQSAYQNSFYYDSCYVIPTTSAPSMYQAEYFKTGYPDINVNAPLVGVSQNEYWDISKVSGSDAQVKFGLRTPVIASASSGTLVAAHYENGHWVSAQGSTISTCAITDSFIVSKPMSNFSPFTFGYLNDASVPVVPSTRVKGLGYKFYQGTFTTLPDFNALTPLATGTSNNVDPGVRPSGIDYNYAFKWDGFITIPTPGNYTFETISDDGSKVYFNSPYCVNGPSTVNNDGVHSGMSVTNTINILAAGTYPITITYFQGYSGQSMQLLWSGPGISRQVIPDTAFSMAAPTTNPPQPGTGLNYKYFEGNFNTLPDFSSLTPIKTGNTPNVDISVRPAGVDDHFAFTWDGTITIPTTGTYTFETVSDDGSKLYFNGNALVNNDGLHAPTSASGNVTIAAGTYPISISFFEKDGGQSMQVYWTGPGISRQQIPDAAFGSGTIAPPASSGLNYKYYEGDFNALPDFNTLTPVKTGTSANADISVRPSGVDDHFAFIWQGYINLPTAGTYTFETISDDGSKIYFNTPYGATANTLVNNDGLHAPTSVTGTVTVQSAGTYPITITYFEKDGGQTMQLYWSGPGISRQPIPDAAFVTGGIPPSSNGGLNYKYYEGNFDMLPDYTTLTPVKTGTTNNVDISIRPSGVNDYFAFIWNGYINLPAAGTYTFETVSDDGSKVYFNMAYAANGSSLVSNDGLHAPTSATGTVTVSSAGKYPITITFFEKNGGETMQLYWTGPGINRQLIPDNAFTTTAAATDPVILSGVITELNNSLKDGSETSHITKLYPNPFVETFTIDYYNSGNVKDKVDVDVFDLSGKLIYKYQPASLLPGYNRWLINMGNAKPATGVYLARLSINGLPSKTIKLIRAKN